MVNQRRYRTFESNFLEFITNNFLLSLYYLFFFIGAVIRIIAALKATGIYHPDEIYQSLEIAHLSVYGSGYIAPEFSTENPGNEFYTSSRSWIFPLIFAGLMHIGETLNMNYYNQTLVMIRLFLGFNSILLIPAVKKFTEEFTGNGQVGLLAGIAISLWFRIIEISVRPFTNTFFLPLLFYSMYRVVHLIHSEKKASSYDQFITLIGLGIVSYVRVDLGILIFAVFLTTFKKNQLKSYIMLIIDAMMGWLIGAAVDYRYYGKFLVVPYHWFRFNIESSDIFGVYPVYFYFLQLIIYDKLLILTITSLFLVIFSLSKKIEQFNKLKNLLPEELSRTYIRLFFANLIAWSINSSIWDLDGTHKEIRFMMGTLCLTLAFFAYSLYYAQELIFEAIVYRKIKKLIVLTDEAKMRRIRIDNAYVKNLLLVIFLILLLVSTTSGYKNRYHRESFADINSALSWIGEQEDVQDVMILSVWYLTGGQTYLHSPNSTLITISLQSENFFDYQMYLVRNELKNNSTNYFIIPYYEINRAGGSTESLFSTAIEYNWSPVKVIDGSLEIWKQF